MHFDDAINEVIISEASKTFKRLLPILNIYFFYIRIGKSIYRSNSIGKMMMTQHTPGSGR